MSILLVVTCLVSLYALVITAMWYVQRAKTWPKPSPRKLSTPVKASNENHAAEDDDEDLSKEVINRANEAQRLHQTFQKFVPRQFVDHFAKGGAENLGLGYANEDEVAVMFCDIRGFTGLSENMTPQQLMNFLNAYFLRMNAPIHDNNGFIDKFIGDAIMALFDHPAGTPHDKAGDAVRAALDLQKALKLYNKHRANSGYSKINSGVGIHLGPVVLGTVGSDDRMDTTVLGDTVNIAQRIEALTKYFQLDILVSQTVVEQASERIQFKSRSVDEVLLRGKSYPIEIFEVFDHLSDSEQADRIASQHIIREGIAMRNARNYKGALSLFGQAQTNFPNDPALVHHVRLCEQLLHDPEWDGFVRI